MHSRPASNVMGATAHAKEAVDHGKQGQAKELVAHAEKALQYAERGGKGSHVAEGMKHLKEAIEHGKAGHADVGSEYAEAALQHLSEAKRQAFSRLQAGGEETLLFLPDCGLMGLT